MMLRRPTKSSSTTGLSTTRFGLRPITRLPISPRSPGDSTTRDHATEFTALEILVTTSMTLATLPSLEEPTVRSRFEASVLSSTKSTPTCEDTPSSASARHCSEEIVTKNPHWSVTLCLNSSNGPSGWRTTAWRTLRKKVLKLDLSLCSPSASVLCKYISATISLLDCLLTAYQPTSSTSTRCL